MIHTSERLKMNISHSIIHDVLEIKKRPQSFTVGILKGEGVGPELIQAALVVLSAIEKRLDIKFSIRHGGAIGLTAKEECGCELSNEVIQFCEDIFKEQGAIFAGPGGGRFVYLLRQQFNLLCKIVPIFTIPELQKSNQFNSDFQSTDIIIVRENLGDIYFANAQDHPSEIKFSYSLKKSEIENIITIAANLAKLRKQSLCVVVKEHGTPALAKFWIEYAKLIADQKEIKLTIGDIDYIAYQLLHSPQDFDVIVTTNCYGDILSDLGGLIMGGRGLTYGANFSLQAEAVYQTNHGAAHDIANRNIANPLAQIFALSMMLTQSFNLPHASQLIHDAIACVLRKNYRTFDINSINSKIISTQKMAELVAQEILTDVLVVS